MASNGRLTRFNRDLITVYVNPIPLEERQAKVYQETLIRSLELWEKATQGKLQFQFATDPTSADIRIRWVHQRSHQGKYESIGETMLIRKAEEFHVEIEISWRNQTTLKPLDPEILQAALLHEIGHAIGLWGHSEDANDVMYFAATAKAPTARDIATWLKVRETPVNTPFCNQAIDALETEIQKKPKDARNHYLIGMVHAELGDYRLAVKAFQQALETDPQLSISTIQIAQIFQQQGMYNLAIKHYTRALRTELSAEVFGALGTLSLLQEQFDQAVDFFQQALRLAPDSARLDQNLLAAYHRWGFQLLKANRFPEAIRCLKHGLARFPFSEILLYDLAVTYESEDEYQSALDIYQQVLRISPEYAAAKLGIATTLNNLGAQRARNREWEQAIAYYQQALEYDLDCHQAHHNLKATLMRLGWEQNAVNKLDSAILTYQKLLKIAPENARAHNNLGIIYFNKLEYEKSIACFGAALSLDANYEEAEINLDFVKRQYAFDTMKRALGPVLIVLLVSFILMKVTMRGADKRSTTTTKR